MTKTQEALLSKKFGSAQAALKHFVQNETREALSAGAGK